MAPDRDPFPLHCVLAKEVCVEARALLPRLSCAYPFWVQLFGMDQGNVPRGLFSPPLITNIYPSHVVPTPANCCQQKLSALMEKAESNHRSISGNHIEQTTYFGDAA